MSGENRDPVRVVTFGCRLNAYESEWMRENVSTLGAGDTVIVNTCAVTAEAERQVRQAIRKLHRENPEARIIVTGCAAQLAPERYAAMAGVVRVLGNREKLEAVSFAPGGGDAIRVSDIAGVRETAPHMVEGFEGRSRAFVQVQQGCDHRCTFCIVPFARGPNRSHPLSRIAEQVRILLAAGVPEFVLTGVDIASWGTELAGTPRLGSLVRGLLDAVPGLARLRLSSLDPAAIDDELIDLLTGEPRLLPYVHLSAQAGDDMILKRMRRRHSRADLVRLIDRLRTGRADIAIGADMIAGFPTETEAMFENGLALVGECGISHLHVFPFSPRPGTPAARMPRVPGTAVRERALRLREAGAAEMARVLAGRVGTTVTAVLEEGGRARDDHYLPLRVEGLTEPPPAGTVATVAVTGSDGTVLMGECR